MEEDNSLDIIKWLFREGTTVDCAGRCRLEQNARMIDCEARLRGNLFAVRQDPAGSVGGEGSGSGSAACSLEPLLIVCEKVQVERCGSQQQNSFRLKYGNDELVFVCPPGAEKSAQEQTEEWILRLSMASHRIIQAEYDQAMHSHFATTPFGQPLNAADESNATASTATTKEIQMLRNYYLTKGFASDQSFSITQCAAVPNRRVVCRETMYETKLSMVVPVEAVKLFLRWATELRDDLLANLWTVRNAVLVEALHTAVRHLNSNIDAYTQASEFLSAYTGGCFRPSTEKYRVAFAPVPTNLHVQHFSVNGKDAAKILTAGACSAIPLRFSNGGLYRLRNKFNAGLEPSQLDHTDEARFHKRRIALTAIKRQIGDISRRLDTEWGEEVQQNATKSGTADKVGLAIYAEIKQIYETLMDMVQSFPIVSNLVDALCEGGFANSQRRSGGSTSDGKSPSSPSASAPRDSFTNQMDRIDAEIISLGSKMSILDCANNDEASAAGDEKAKKTKEGVKEKPLVDSVFRENVRHSLHSTLDSLHQLAESLLIAQMLGLVLCFRKKPDCATFFHLQLRYDLLLSQTLTVVCTALLTSLDQQQCAITVGCNSEEEVEVLFEKNNNEKAHPLPVLITWFSFLSCYGKEQGMVEDMFEIFTLFPGATEFRLVEAPSSVSQTCIPQIEGHRTALRVSIPVPANVLKHLASTGRLPAPPGQWFRVLIVLWNVGVNHEALMSATMGMNELEEVVNRTAVRQLQDYARRFELFHYPSERHRKGSNKNVENEEKLVDPDGSKSHFFVDDGDLVKSKEQFSSSSSSSRMEQIWKYLHELDTFVSSSQALVRKNLPTVFARVMALTNLLGGTAVLGCKSGKDRTGMAVTLEEGRILRETVGLSQQQTSEIVDTLRARGVRRENCRKNIGKAMYAFSPFQIGFVPVEFRPPSGTYTNLVST